MSRKDESPRRNGAAAQKQTRELSAPCLGSGLWGKRPAVWGAAATVAMTLGLAACSAASDPGPASAEIQSDGAAQSENTEPALPESADGDAIETDTQNEGQGDASEATPAESAPDTSGWELSSAFSPGVQPQAAAIVTGLRVAEHPGYDRVVLDLTGDGPVGWEAFYTDSVVGQGKGDPLPLEGSVYLNLDVTGVSIPVSDAERAAYYTGQESVQGSIVTALYDSTYEGRAQVAIAMDKPRPFQVFALTDPLRVVVDIAND